MEGIIMVKLPYFRTYFVLIFVIQGFDEYMNIVLDDAAEVNVKTSVRKPLGIEFFH
jgi:hypothetical protein